MSKLKRKLLCGFTASTAVPFIALPFINAKSISGDTTNSIEQDENIGTRRLTNIPDLDVHYSPEFPKNFYTVRFMENEKYPEWGVYGEIYKGKLDETMDFVVPSTVVQDGVEYKIRGIDTRGRWSGYNYDPRVTYLDFSKAYNLCYIAQYSFDHHNKKNGYLDIVCGLIFGGMPNLIYVGSHAFRSVNIDYGDRDKFLTPAYQWDFSASKLDRLESRAFQAACGNRSNAIGMIILPRTLRKLGEDCFGINNDFLGKDEKPRFKKIILTDDDPPENLLDKMISMPETISTGEKGCQIIVPPNCKETYRTLNNFDHNFDHQIYESKIEFTEGFQGSTSIAAKRGSAGFDPLRWNPYHTAKQRAIDNAITRLSHDYDGRIWLDDQHRLNWSPDLPTGEYRFAVESFIYDDDKNEKMSAAISEPITLTIVDDAYVSGGTNNLYSIENKAGEDPLVWTPYVPGAIQKETKYKIFPETYQDKIYVTTSTVTSTTGTYQTAKIHWKDSFATGTYPFVLEANMYIEGNKTPISYRQPIVLNVGRDTGDFTYDLKIGEKTYSGEPITTQSTLTATVNIPDKWSLSGNPNVSVNTLDETIFAVSKASQTNVFNIEIDPTKYDHLKFNLYSQADLPSNAQHQYFYSPTIEVKKSNDVTKVLDLPRDIYTTKNIAGSQTINVLPSDSTAILTNATLQRSSGETKKEKLDKLHIKVADNKKDVIVSWDKDFAETTANLDWFDARINFNIQTESGASETFITSASFIFTNDAEIKYEGSDNLYCYAGQTKVFDQPFKLLINGQQPESADYLTYGCVFNVSDPSLYEQKIGMKINDLEAQLQCGAVIDETDETLNGLPITIYAFDTNKQVVATKDVVLYIGNILKLQDVTEKITGVSGTSGKTQPFSATFNGQEDPSIQYTLIGADGFSIKDNCIAWDESIASGSYVLTLTATKQVNNKEYSDTKHIEAVIDAKPPEPEPEVVKSNTGLIIGVSVGGSVVLAGATTGTVIGVKKHKAKLGKKK